MWGNARSIPSQDKNNNIYKQHYQNKSIILRAATAYLDNAIVGDIDPLIVVFSSS